MYYSILIVYVSCIQATWTTTVAGAGTRDGATVARKTKPMLPLRVPEEAANVLQVTKVVEVVEVMDVVEVMEVMEVMEAKK